jgi:hypothetical protein
MADDPNARGAVRPNTLIMQGQEPLAAVAKHADSEPNSNLPQSADSTSPAPRGSVIGITPVDTGLEISTGNKADPSAGLVLIEGSIEVNLHPRKLDAYLVLASELDALENAVPSWSLAFFSTSIGISVTFGVVLASVTLSVAASASFLAMFIATFVLATFFGARTVQGFRAKRQLSQRIVRGQDGSDPICGQ